MVSTINKLRLNPRMTSLVFNRRHLMCDKDGKDHGTVSLLFTTQHYKMIPNSIRESVTSVVFFGG